MILHPAAPNPPSVSYASSIMLYLNKTLSTSTTNIRNWIQQWWEKKQSKEGIQQWLTGVPWREGTRTLSTMFPARPRNSNDGKPEMTAYPPDGRMDRLFFKLQQKKICTSLGVGVCIVCVIFCGSGAYRKVYGDPAINPIQFAVIGIDRMDKMLHDHFQAASEADPARPIQRGRSSEADTPTTNDQRPTEAFYVVSLQGVNGAHDSNAGRLDKFRADWLSVCTSYGFPSPRFQHCPGVLSPIHGHGLTQAFVTCFEHALDGQAETIIIFEDDARLFRDDASSNTMSEAFCNPAFRHKLWNENLPKDALAVLLGGWKWGLKPDDGLDVPAQGISFRKVEHSYGTYGFALRRESVSQLQRHFITTLESSGPLAPDETWHPFAWGLGKENYVTEPLLVWHEGGHSNTWNRTQEDIVATSALHK